ncbi:MAG: hypothetical protein FRX49_10376 [Trebouxia sp. A1-2]|nr:MAG: hypothetical protein FRX49_10376 [Trebouxia sp. A1-2]
MSMFLQQYPYYSRNSNLETPETNLTSGPKLAPFQEAKGTSLSSENTIPGWVDLRNCLDEGCLDSRASRQQRQRQRHQKTQNTLSAE